MDPKKGLEKALYNITQEELNKIEEILWNLRNGEYAESIIRAQIRPCNLDLLLENLISRYGNNGEEAGLLKIAAASAIVLLRYRSPKLPLISREVVGTLLYEMTQNVHEYTRETMEEIKDNNRLLYAFFETMREKIGVDYDQTLIIKIALSAFYKIFINQSIADQLNKLYNPQPIHFLPK